MSLVWSHLICMCDFIGLRLLFAPAVSTHLLGLYRCITATRSRRKDAIFAFTLSFPIPVICCGNVRWTLYFPCLYFNAWSIKRNVHKLWIWYTSVKPNSRGLSSQREKEQLLYFAKPTVNGGIVRLGVSFLLHTKPNTGHMHWNTSS